MTPKAEDTDSNPQDEDQNSGKETMRIEQLITTTTNTPKQPNISIHSIPRSIATTIGPRDRSPMMSHRLRTRKDLTTGRKIPAVILPDRLIK